MADYFQQGSQSITHSFPLHFNRLYDRHEVLNMVTNNGSFWQTRFKKMPVVQNELIISWITAWQKAIRTQAGLELSDFVKMKNAPTPTDRRENISDTMTQCPIVLRFVNYLTHQFSQGPVKEALILGTLQDDTTCSVDGDRDLVWTRSLNHSLVGYTVITQVTQLVTVTIIRMWVEPQKEKCPRAFSE